MLELEAVLVSAERKRANLFVCDEPRRAFVASRAALRSILGRYLCESPGVVSIRYAASGKPRLESGDLCFNLAHSGSLTLIAVTRDGEIGVDVELVRPVDQAHEIAARNFHSAERDALRDADTASLPAAFMRCWTRKEAVLKAIGTGLGYPLSAFDVLTGRHPDQPTELPIFESLPPTRFTLHDLDPCTGYAAAVATLKVRQPPLGFTYSL
ncbi:MAG: 4'-phosphopantetheinyl transferase superfamily protein [Pirellulales bacterium]